MGGVDCGYSCTEGWVTLTDESVTTAADEEGGTPEANLAYSTPIDAETVKVTFDGTEYICTGREELGSMEYGAIWDDATSSFDWSTYPFNIYPGKVHIRLFTETAGTHQVKIETFEETIETSECFRKAVKSVGGNEPLKVIANNGLLDKSWQQIADAYPNVYVEYLDTVDSIQANHRYSVTDVSETPGKVGTSYGVTFGEHTFTAAAPDRYPANGSV